MSRNLVKQFFAAESEEKRLIDTEELLRLREERNLAVKAAAPDSDGFVSGLDAETVDVPSDGGESGNVIKAGEDPAALLEKARAEAQEILSQAQAQADQILKDAAARAESESADIREQARKQGYDAGLQKAKSEEEILKHDYHARAEELEADYEKRLAEMEPLLVDAITAVYEHIFQVELGSQREILEHLISNTMHGLEGSHSFLIHVSKEDYSYVNMQKKQILNGAVSGTDVVDIVEDMTLDKNQCMIETDSGIFDCGLDTQLSELRRKLMLLSWSKEE